MSSQVEFSSVSNLSLLSDVEFKPAFEEFSSNLMNDFHSQSNANRITIINMLERFFKLLKTLNDADQEILRNIVSVSVQAFSENFTQAKNFQNITSDSLKCILQENIRLLTSFDELIAALTCMPDLNIKDIPSIPVDIITALLFGFEYCKNASDLTTVNDQVTGLFKTCYTLLCHYFVFINKLRIECQYEFEFGLLIEIVDKMYQIGSLVISLDLKTMAELWKGLVQMLKNYATFLRKEFDISKIIRFLLRQIVEKIASLQANCDEKMLNLTLKICAFLLKIMIKLCECFEQCFGECCGELFEFILLLHKRSSFLAEFSKLDINITSKIDAHLLPGIDPLIDVLVNDRQFVKFYLTYEIGDKTDCDKIAFLLISSLILRKLLGSSDEIVQLWITDEEASVLHFTFNMISDCDKELYYDGIVNIPCLDVSLNQEVNLYDALLVSFATFIINEVSKEKFHVVENLLVNHLLESNVTVGLFVSDLWCILARYGSSELCFEHVQYLVSVSNELPEGGIQVLVKSLTKRLFRFLSFNHQLKIISELPPDQNFVNCYDSLNDKFKGQVCQKIVAEMANKCKYIRNNLKQKFDADDYSKAIQLTSTMCALEPAYWKDYTNFVIDFVIQTWKRLGGHQLHEMTLDEFKSVFNSLEHLCKVTCSVITQLSNVHVLTILRAVQNVISSESLYAKLCCLKILRSLSSYTIESYLDEITNTLAECFCRCLTDADPLVKQHSLDEFTKFSHLTKYENIISLTISKDKRVAEQFTSYLQRIPRPLTEDQTFHQFFSIVVRKASERRSIEGVKVEDNFHQQMVAKRIKLHDDLDDSIEQIKRHLDKICDDRIRNRRINDQQKEGLRRILCRVEAWRNYL